MITDFDVSGVYEPLTTEQQVKVQELSQLAAALEFPPTYEVGRRANAALFFSRWLYARKWDVDAAFTMLKDACAWRIAQGSDTTPRFPSAVNIRGYDIDEIRRFHGTDPRPTNQRVDEVVKQLPCVAAWHKHDAQGRPVYIERLGRIPVRNLVAKCKQLVPPGEPIDVPIVDVHLHSNEVGGTLTRYRSQLPGAMKNLCQVTVIMDCDGVTMGHFYGPALDLLKAESTLDQKYYPEGLFMLYVANAPRIITIGWAIVKMWLDQRVQNKVIFLPPKDTKERLCAAIGEDNLPEFLGGRCRCEGECCPVSDGGEDDDTLTQVLQINRGAKLAKTYDIIAGHSFVWEMSVEKRDVTVVLAFQATGDASPVTPVAQFQRSARASGSYTAPANGQMCMTFDNSFAWIHGKKLLLRATTIAARAETTGETESADPSSPE